MIIQSQSRIGESKLASKLATNRPFNHSQELRRKKLPSIFLSNWSLDHNQESGRKSCILFFWSIDHSITAKYLGGKTASYLSYNSIIPSLSRIGESKLPSIFATNRSFYWLIGGSFFPSQLLVVIEWVISRKYRRQFWLPNPWLWLKCLNDHECSEW